MSDITWGSPVDKEYDVVPFEIGGTIRLTYTFDEDEEGNLLSATFSQIKNLFNGGSIIVLVDTHGENGEFTDIYYLTEIVENYNNKYMVYFGTVGEGSMTNGMLFESNAVDAPMYSW